MAAALRQQKEQQRLLRVSAAVEIPFSVFFFDSLYKRRLDAALRRHSSSSTTTTTSSTNSSSSSSSSSKDDEYNLQQMELQHYPPAKRRETEGERKIQVADAARTQSKALCFLWHHTMIPFSPLFVFVSLLRHLAASLCLWCLLASTAVSLLSVSFVSLILSVSLYFSRILLFLLPVSLLALSLSLSLCMSVSPSLSPSVSLSLSLSLCISVSASLSPSVSLSPSLSLCMSVSPSLSPSVSLCLHLILSMSFRYAFTTIEFDLRFDQASGVSFCFLLDYVFVVSFLLFVFRFSKFISSCFFNI